MTIDYYKEYAKQVVSGEVVACKYIRQACERFLKWFDVYDFRTDKVDRAVNFISHLTHFTGRHNGKPFVLQPWQTWIIANIFGFYHSNTDKRVIRYCYIELARKSGKTALAAAISLYMLVADGESGSEVEIVANSAKQAKICFEMASNYLQGIDKKGKYFQRYRDTIKFDKMKAKLQILSSEAGNNDGYNSYCFTLDEAHEQRDSRLWDVMCSSQGMRENSLGIIITTAGFNLHGFCYEFRKMCTEVLSGAKEDDSQFAAIYTLDEDDDWRDSSTWVKANPSLGVTISEEYLQAQVKRAINNTSLEVGVRTKNLNQWLSSSDVWISNDLLLECTQEVNLENFNGYTAYVGVDLAAVSDMTAVSYMIPLDGKFYFKTDYYLPSAALTENSNAELYKLWKRKGYLKITEGNVTDYDCVLADILRASTYLFIDKVAYDSYNATQWAINATAEGLPLQPYSQSLWNFNRPTKEFERLIKSGKVVIDNNEITRWCFGNVALKADHNDNTKPVKGGTEQEKIDGVISMLEALGVMLETPQFNNVITAV